MINTSSPSLLRKGAFTVSALSMVPHIFCCGLPVVAAVIAVGSTTGLAATLEGNPLYNLVNTWHRELLGLAVVSVMASGVLSYIAYKIDCRVAATSACHHGDCQPVKQRGFRLFMVSLALLVVDVSWFAAEELWLGLHHEHEMAEAHSDVEPAAGEGHH